MEGFLLNLGELEVNLLKQRCAKMSSNPTRHVGTYWNNLPRLLL